MSHKLQQKDGFRQHFWEEVLDMYEKEIFLDTTIVCSDKISIQCHALIFGASSPVFHRPLKFAYEEEAFDRVVVLPDWESKDVKDLVYNLYKFLARKVDSEAFDHLENLARDLQIGVFDARSLKQETSVPVVTPESIVAVKLETTDDYVEDVEEVEYEDEGGNDDDYEDEDYDEYYEPEPAPKKTATRKRGRKATKTKAKTTKKRKIKEDIDEDEEEEEEDVDYGGYEAKVNDKNVPEELVEKMIHTIPEMSLESQLYSILKEKKEGAIKAKFKQGALKYSFQWTKGAYKDVKFMSYMLIRRHETEWNRLVARPLCWCDSDSDDVSTQFDDVIRAWKHLFGFSKKQLYYNREVYTRQGNKYHRKNRSSSSNFVIKRKLANVSEEDLDRELEREDIKDALMEYPMSIGNIDLPGKVFHYIELDHLMKFEEGEGVCLLLWNKSGVVGGYNIHCEEDGRDQASKDNYKVVFDVWCKGNKEDGGNVPSNKYIHKEYDKLINPLETMDVINKFRKDDPDRKARDNMLNKTIVCKTCGKVFPYNTVYEMSVFSAHRITHNINEFKCDCPGVDFEAMDYAEKQKHVRLVHNKEKYTKCDKCGKAFTKLTFPTHSKICPGPDKRPIICEVCGKVFTSQHDHWEHKQTHEINTCEFCGQAIKGRRYFIRHMREEHQATTRCTKCNKDCLNIATHKCSAEEASTTCKECGRVLNCREALKRHVARNHNHAALRYPCMICAKRFMYPSALNSHIRASHLKDRSFNCRYGCGENFTNQQGLNNHEKNIHGMSYTQRKRFEEARLLNMN